MRRRYCTHCNARPEATWRKSQLVKLVVKHTWDGGCHGQEDPLDLNTWHRS